MKLGICTSPSRARRAAESGFDYIEVNAAAVAGMSDEEYAAAKKDVLDAGIPAETANCMLPGTLRVTGDTDLDALREYGERMFPRVAGLGVRVVVFGSGVSRKVPDGVPMEKAMEQLVVAARLMAEIAAKSGVVIAAEPLNAGETNIINSVADGGEWVRAVGHPNFRLLADYYHMGKSGEGLGAISQYGDVLVHTHIAHPETRKAPAPGDGGGYEGFVGALKGAGYDARISLEANVKDDEYDAEIPVMMEYLRGIL